MTHRQKLLLALSILISAVFLIVAFRGLNPASVIDTLRGANWLMIVLAAGLYLPAMVLITRRWKFVLDDTVPVPVRGLFPLVAIGYMGNNIYPFRAGEVLRLALLRQGWRVPVVRGAATILVERCFDGLVMLTFLLVPAVFIDLSDGGVLGLGATPRRLPPLGEVRHRPVAQGDWWKIGRYRR
ncbi:MAG: flippase-like domain-containing protein [Anaerolineae bacterium]|nr:flippase-like domain-containing protein [Anaerolineae bacterium]